MDWVPGALFLSRTILLEVDMLQEPGETFPGTGAPCCAWAGPSFPAVDDGAALPPGQRRASLSWDSRSESPWRSPVGRSSYIICGAQSKMKMHGCLLKYYYEFQDSNIRILKQAWGSGHLDLSQGLVRHRGPALPSI